MIFIDLSLFIRGMFTFILDTFERGYTQFYLKIINLFFFYKGYSDTFSF